MKQILLLTFIFVLTACGKSPLLMQKETSVSGSSGISSAKTLSKLGLALSVQWLSPLSSEQEAHALVIVKKADVVADLPENFSIFLWMPSMGHGSSPITVKKLATGLYELTNVYFIMDGAWELKVQIKNADTISDETTFEYNI